MTEVTPKDVQRWMKQEAPNLSKLVQMCGVTIAMKEGGDLIVRERNTEINMNDIAGPRIPCKLEIPNYQIAKTLDIYLRRYGARKSYVELRPQGSVLSIPEQDPDWLVGQKLSASAQAWFVAMRQLWYGKFMSFELREIRQRAKELSQESVEPKRLRALLRFLNKGFKEAQKLESKLSD